MTGTSDSVQAFSPTLVVAAHGTTHDEARKRSLDVLMRDAVAAFPELRVELATVSPKVRRALAARGVHAQGVTDMLDALAKGGVQKVFVQPVEVVGGTTAEGVRDEVGAVSSCFGTLRLGDPLLTSGADVRGVAQALVERHPLHPWQAVVLMGHGTGSAADGAFGRVQAALVALGRPDVVVGAYRGKLDVGHVLDRLSALGGPAKLTNVVLAPLMVCAGAHAIKEMAGDAPTSWKSRLGDAGYCVHADLTGLGELAAVRRVFLEHARRLVGTS